MLWLFVCEIVQEKDFDFFKSMRLKTVGDRSKDIFARANRVDSRPSSKCIFSCHWGGMHDVPLIYDLWWNGYVVRLEVEDFRSRGIDVKALS